MDAIQLFLLDHARIHSRAMPDDPPGLLEPHVRDVPGERHFGDRMGDLLTAGLAEDLLARSPGMGLNSIAWCIWHSARSEDVAINVMLADRDQVLDDGWLTRLGIPFRHIGSDMAEAEVAAFNASIDTRALLDYWVAVGRRTRAVVRPHTAADLDEPVADDAGARLQAAGALSAGAEWVVPFWTARTKGWFLSLVAGHSFNHFGEAAVSANQFRRAVATARGQADAPPRAAGTVR